MRSRRIWTLIGCMLIVGLFVAACGGEAPTPAETGEEPAETEPTEAPMDEEEQAPAEGVTEIRWFVGLGTGQQPEQVEAQEAVVEAFNASHDSIELVLEIVQNDIASDTLSTQIASGNPPDIVGPVGIAGSNAFAGQWLDLQPLLDSTGYDLSDFEPATVDFYREADGALTALPFGNYPSFIYYNTSLFDEAGLPYPPHEVGEQYMGEEWNWDTLAETARILTVDANGNDASMDAFDPENIVQFGYHTQFTDPRGEATFFGAGSFVDENGDATVPEHWREAWQWHYDGIWEQNFIPNDSYLNSDLLASGNAWGSGNTAMAAIHLWCHGCYEGDDWDIAVIPSYEGETTAKLHVDTFRIMSSTEHPDEAFEVLTYLLSGDQAEALLNVYGSMPARQSLQDAFFAGLDEQHPQGVDWQVARDMLSYPDNPNHESNMPSFNRATERIGQFQSLYRGTPDLDLQGAIDELVADLQLIFEEAE